MMKKVFEIAANILFWGFTGFFIVNGFSIKTHEVEIVDGIKTVEIVRDDTAIVMLIICILFSAVMSYANLANLLRLRKGESRFNIIVLSLLLFFGSTIGYFVLQDILLFSERLPMPASLVMGVFTFYYTVSITYGTAKVWLHSENKRKELLLEKKQAELDLLRSQLHPHFLFNALNNLLSMVNQERDPNLASSLDKLSGLLRYVVYDTPKDKVPVKKEIDFIQNFAELHLLRFEKEELGFILEIKGEHDQTMIEPGIFIPFIENAFKYGTEPEKRSKIKVVFDLSDRFDIMFTVTNPVYPAMQSGNGTGIQSTKERLELVYPNKHVLKITSDRYFKVELKIETA